MEYEFSGHADNFFIYNFEKFKNLAMENNKTYLEMLIFWSHR